MRLAHLHSFSLFFKENLPVVDFIIYCPLKNLKIEFFFFDTSLKKIQRPKIWIMIDCEPVLVFTRIGQIRPKGVEKIKFKEMKRREMLRTGKNIILTCLCANRFRSARLKRFFSTTEQFCAVPIYLSILFQKKISQLELRVAIFTKLISICKSSVLTPNFSNHPNFVSKKQNEAILSFIKIWFRQEKNREVSARETSNSISVHKTSSNPKIFQLGTWCFN